jgi:hypothetical protein
MRKHSCATEQILTSASAAMTFVTEAETWPVFCKFMELLGAPVPMSREAMQHQAGHCVHLAADVSLMFADEPAEPTS